MPEDIPWNESLFPEKKAAPSQAQPLRVVPPAVNPPPRVPPRVVPPAANPPMMQAPPVIFPPAYPPRPPRARPPVRPAPNFAYPPGYQYPAPPRPAAQRPSYWQRRLFGIGMLVILFMIFLSGGIYAVHGYVTASTISTEATATVVARVSARASATATYLASLRNPYPPYGGTLVLNDPLVNASRGYHWEVGSDGVGDCEFKGGAFHVSIVKQNYIEYCVANSINVSDFAYQVQMTMLKGDRGGIVFRSSDTSGYYFSTGIDGSYALAAFGNGFYNVLQKGTISPVKLKQPVVMAVVARGTDIELYVNYHKIGSVSDSTLSSGEVSVAAEDVNTTTEIAFNNAKVWKL